MPAGDQNLSFPPELRRLSTFIDSRTECLAGPSIELRSLSLCAAKHIFDWALETEECSKPHLGTLLTTLTEVVPPQTRSRARNSASVTQRLGPRQTKINIRETPLPSLFIEGMNTDQIWQQLDLRATRVCENLEVLQGEDEDERVDLEGDSDNDGSEVEDETAMDVDDDESPWEGLSHGEEDDSSTSTAECVVDLQEESSEDNDEDDGALISMLDAGHTQQKPSTSRSWYTTLDDGFFDLAKFNAETNEVEAEELTKSKLDLVVDEDSTEESEVELLGSVDELATMGEGDSRELFYNDFFEPPTRMLKKSLGLSKVRFHKRVSVKKIKAIGKGVPVSYDNEEEEEEEEEEEGW